MGFPSLPGQGMGGEGSLQRKMEMSLSIFWSVPSPIFWPVLGRLYARACWSVEFGGEGERPLFEHRY